MGDAFGPGKGCIDGGTIGAQNRLWIDQGLEHLTDMGSIELFQDEIRSCTATIPDHQYRDVILAGAPCAPDATAMARWSGQMALTFQRFQKEALIRFHDALFV